MLHRQLGCFCRFPETCECYGPKEHKFGIVSSTTELTAEPPIPGVEITLDHNDVGKWLLVLYDSEPYIGEVLQYLPREDEVLVKVMNQRGKNLFNWPVIEDCIWYSRENVVTLITGPTKSKKQRHFSLEAQDWFKYCSLLSWFLGSAWFLSSDGRHKQLCRLDVHERIRIRLCLRAGFPEEHAQCTLHRKNDRNPWNFHGFQLVWCYFSS